MKILNKEIEVLAYFSNDGLKPLRLRLKNENDYIVMKIHVTFTTKEKLAGNDMFIYRCESKINDTRKIYELKYELNTCKWFLFKI